MLLAPPIQRILLDFGVESPQITRFTISLGLALRQYWYVALIAVCLWPPLYVEAMLLSRGSEAVAPRRLWRWTTWLAPALVFGYVVLGLLIPLVSLMLRLS
jgi:hypothetical protein